MRRDVETECVTTATGAEPVAEAETWRIACPRGETVSAAPTNPQCLHPGTCAAQALHASSSGGRSGPLRRQARPAAPEFPSWIAPRANARGAGAPNPWRRVHADRLPHGRSSGACSIFHRVPHPSADCERKCPARPDIAETFEQGDLLACRSKLMQLLQSGRVPEEVIHGVVTVAVKRCEVALERFWMRAVNFAPSQ